MRFLEMLSVLLVFGLFILKLLFHFKRSIGRYLLFIFFDQGLVGRNFIVFGFFDQRGVGRLVFVRFDRFL